MIILITAQLSISSYEYVTKYTTWLINRSASSRLLEGRLTPYEAWTGRTPGWCPHLKLHGSMPHTGWCPLHKIKRDHKIAPTGDWLLFLGMREEHEAWLLVNPISGKEAEVAFVTFHEDKWLNTWINKRAI